MTLSYIPTSREQTDAWQAAGQIDGPVPAHQLSPAYLEAFGIDAACTDDVETAEYGCLYLASVSCLLEHSERVVLVVDAESTWTPVGGRDAESGCGTLDGFSWSQVRSYYLDDAGARDDVATAAAAVRGGTMADAWEDAAVASLLAGHSLLWHDVAEWGNAG